MNIHLSAAVAMLSTLLSMPVAAVETGVGSVIAEQGNRALASIRQDAAQALADRMRDQLDLCGLTVKSELRITALSEPGLADVGHVTPRRCSSRREL